MRPTSRALESLPFEAAGGRPGSLGDMLQSFTWRGRKTRIEPLRVELEAGASVSVDVFVNEFWTSRQRAAHSLHEVSYRACFKPQVPQFFIERLTAAGAIVYDPFMGRGTTLLEAALMGRVPYGCDINPLSTVLIAPRLDPPDVDEIEAALADIDLTAATVVPEELLAFYHPETLHALCALREHLRCRAAAGRLSRADAWIRMVAVNRLTGHSRGFLSVYTMPPNQAVSIGAQLRINARRNQSPPRRDMAATILAKSRSLLGDQGPLMQTRLRTSSRAARLLTGDASATPAVTSDSVALVVTSPPFLDVVDYRTDNWLRCWFCDIDASAVAVTTPRKLASWETFIAGVFKELRRVLAPSGHVAFEVGEVRGGTVRLEEPVICAAVAAGLTPMLVMVNDQHFTKTANCWGVSNNRKGTNTNRIVVLRKT